MGNEYLLFCKYKSVSAETRMDAEGGNASQKNSVWAIACSNEFLSLCHGNKHPSLILPPQVEAIFSLVCNVPH